MNAIAFKTFDSEGYLTKHVGYINEDGHYVYVRRSLIKSKKLESHSISNWEVLKTYKDRILIEKTIYFYKSTWQDLNYIFHSLNEDLS